MQNESLDDNNKYSHLKLCQTMTYYIDISVEDLFGRVNFKWRVKPYFFKKKIVFFLLPFHKKTPFQVSFWYPGRILAASYESMTFINRWNSEKIICIPISHVYPPYSNPIAKPIEGKFVVSINLNRPRGRPANQNVTVAPTVEFRSNLKKFSLCPSS